MKNYVFIGLVSLNVLMFSCEPKASPVVMQTPEPELAEETPPVKDPDRLLPSFLPTIAYPVFITGETTYSSKLKPEAWFSQPVPKPDLGSIAAPGKVPLMLAFGGGLTAGVSNGGLNREAQQFAYPNLVAHQMGIADFKTPLLSENEANGTGIFVYEDPKAEYPRWKEVKNNLAKLEPGQPVKMTPYEGVIHNFAYPNGGTIGASYPYCITCPSQSYSSRFSRYNIKADTLLLSSIKHNQEYDFVIMEDFYDAFASWIVNSPQLDESFSLAAPWSVPTYAMDAIVDKGQKGVVFTIPNFRHLGFMNWYDVAVLKKMVSSISVNYNGLNGASTKKETDEFYLKPTKNVEGMFLTAEMGKPFQAQINDLDILDKAESWIADPDRVVNPSVRKFAKEHNLALVDLATLFEKIHSGTYVTADGLKIDGSMQGNFFSSDGIYPTPIGQAVIANEVITAINQKYGAKIPLINVSAFSSSISSK